MTEGLLEASLPFDLLFFSRTDSLGSWPGLPSVTKNRRHESAHLLKYFKYPRVEHASTQHLAR